MCEALAWLDNVIIWMPPLMRILLWGAASGAIGMILYAFISPQEKMRATRRAQKEARAALWKHDGSFDALQILIRRDLTLSFKHMALLLVPFALSVAPSIGIFYCLSQRYVNAYTSFGWSWMQGFEFWYFLSACIVSLILKITWKLA